MKVTVKISILSLFLVVSTFLYSQGVKHDRAYINNYYDAEAFIYENNYTSALNLLLKLEKVDGKNPNILYKIGFCYLNITGHKTMAEEYLKKAVKNVDFDYVSNHNATKAPIDAYIYLAIAYRVNNKFDLSIESLKTLKDMLLKNNVKNIELNAMIDREERITKNAIHNVNNPVNVEVRNIGSSINSKYSEHSPVITMDNNTLYFTSKRPKAGEPKENQDEDIFVSEKQSNGWGAPKRLEKPVNTETNNETVVGISDDGKKLLFFQSGYGYTGAVYTSELKNGSWSNPKLLINEINSDDRITHATFTKDLKHIYFVSNNKSGHGGLDLFVMHQLSDGKWGTPQPLPANINTKYDEETPFIHPDGVTLYFSSKGHNSMGGYDIFYTKINEDGTYDEPINLGYPINTTDDDVAFVLNQEGTIGYYSKVDQCEYNDLDIFEILFLDKIQDSRIIEYTCNFYDEKGEPLDKITIHIKNLQTGDLIGVCGNTSPGKHEFVLDHGSDYEIIFEADGFSKQVEKLTPSQSDLSKYQSDKKPIFFKDIKFIRYSSEDIVYFYESNAELKPEAISILKKVISQKNENANLLVNVNTANFGKEIDKKRFEEIEKYLIKSGLDKEHIYMNNSNLKANVYNLKIQEKKDYSQKHTSDLNDVIVENILFSFDKYSINEPYYENLDKLANYLNNNPQAVIEIGGHTDILGSDDYNYLLSYNRAKSVKDYLVKKGNKPENIIIEKYGKTNPVLDNHTADGKDNPAGRKYNRRVEFKVLKQGNNAKLIIKELEVAGPKSSQATSNLQSSNNKPLSEKYTIQVFASKTKDDAIFPENLKNVQKHVSKDGWIRYYVGEYNSFEEAKDALSKIPNAKNDYYVRKLSFLNE